MFLLWRQLKTTSVPNMRRIFPSLGWLPLTLGDLKLILQAILTEWSINTTLNLLTVNFDFFLPWMVNLSIETNISFRTTTMVFFSHYCVFNSSFWFQALMLFETIVKLQKTHPDHKLLNSTLKSSGFLLHRFNLSGFCVISQDISVLVFGLKNTRKKKI